MKHEPKELPSYCSKCTGPLYVWNHLHDLWCPRCRAGIVNMTGRYCPKCNNPIWLDGSCFTCQENALHPGCGIAREVPDWL